MMKIKLLLFILLLCVLCNESYAQFDRKLTFTFFAGQANTIAGRKGKTDEDGNARLFPNFDFGAQFGIGAQYNLNRNYSAGATLRSVLFVGYEVPVDPRNNGGVKPPAINDAIFFISSFGLHGKRKFLPGKRINPYITTELNVNLYSAQIAGMEVPMKGTGVAFDEYPQQGNEQIYINSVLIRVPGTELASGTDLGVAATAGADIKISKTMFFFLEGSYNIVFTNYRAALQQNLLYTNINGGLRFSLFKSKTL